MQLELLAWTPQPDKTCATAARLCYSSTDFKRLWSGLGEEEVKSLLERVINSRHLSVLEHASFTFQAEGLSRACTHQLVRHRIASYSQQSQRYTKLAAVDFIIPPKVRGNHEALRVFEEAAEMSQEAYKKMLELAIPAEDARYVLLQAVTSRLVFTMNARELWHFFELRCCESAQWEIRALALLALKKVRGVAPYIFSAAGPTCFHGICPEKEFPCWRENSFYFAQKRERFLQELRELSFEPEEQKLRSYCTSPEQIASILNCRQEQLICTSIVEFGGEIFVFLSPGAMKPKEGFRFLSEQEVRRKSLFHHCFLPLKPLTEQAKYLVDRALLKEEVLYSNSASPWYYFSIKVGELKALLDKISLVWSEV